MRHIAAMIVHLLNEEKLSAKIDAGASLACFIAVSALYCRTLHAAASAASAGVSGLSPYAMRYHFRQRSNDIIGNIFHRKSFRDALVIY